ncbi:hypothetical protein MKX01_006092, partial [Papaver californicum]
MSSLSSSPRNFVSVSHSLHCFKPFSQFLILFKYPVRITCEVEKLIILIASSIILGVWFQVMGSGRKRKRDQKGKYVDYVDKRVESVSVEDKRVVSGNGVE